VQRVAVKGGEKMEIVGKIFLGILCFGVLVSLITVFIAFLCGFKDTMQDPDLDLFLKFVYVVLLVVSFVTIIGWIIASASLLGLF